MSQSVMDGLKAENLLKDSTLLTMVAELKTGLRYRTDDTFISFDDHFLKLQAEVDAIPHIKLADTIPAQQGAAYENELLTHLEEIQDQVERLSIKVIRFRGDITRATASSTETAVAFEAWYTIAAQEYIATTDIKLPAGVIKALARTEFTRLMGSTNLSLTSIDEALAILLRQLDGKKKLAQQKMQLGRDQVNAAFANRLPESLGYSPDGPRFGLLVHDEDEDEGPAPFVSQQTGEVVKPAPVAEEPKVTPVNSQILADLIAEIGLDTAQQRFEESGVQITPQTTITTITIPPPAAPTPTEEALVVLDTLKVLTNHTPTPTATEALDTLGIKTAVALGFSPEILIGEESSANKTPRRKLDLDDEDITPKAEIKVAPALENVFPGLSGILNGTPAPPAPAPKPAAAQKPTTKMVFIDDEE